jgi:hypothetical protein
MIFSGHVDAVIPLNNGIFSPDWPVDRACRGHVAGPKDQFVRSGATRAQPTGRTFPGLWQTASDGDRDCAIPRGRAAPQGALALLHKRLGFRYDCIDIDCQFGGLTLDLNFETTPAAL